jgi:hypothetical protein
MALPELNQPNTKKNTEVRATPARPLGPTVTEAETCFRTPSRKENFEGQPNRAVAEHRHVNAGRKKNSVASGNDDRERGKRGSSWKTMPATGHSFIHKEVTSTPRSASAYYISVHNLLSLHLLSKVLGP